jgi:hypothetical protein
MKHSTGINTRRWRIEMKEIVVTQTIRRKIFTRGKAVTLASFLFAGALASCVSLAFVTRAHNAGTRSPKAPVVVAPAALTQSGLSESEAPQVVRFAVYDVGIYPYEAHASKGLIGVSFEDLSGGSSDVVVARETGATPETVSLIQHADHNPRGRNDLKLEPGRYRVYVADHPENRATLIVD